MSSTYIWKFAEIGLKNVRCVGAIVSLVEFNHDVVEMLTYIQVSPRTQLSAVPINSPEEDPPWSRQALPGTAGCSQWSYPDQILGCDSRRGRTSLSLAWPIPCTARTKRNGWVRVQSSALPLLLYFPLIVTKWREGWGTQWSQFVVQRWHDRSICAYIQGAHFRLWKSLAVTVIHSPMNAKRGILTLNPVYNRLCLRQPHVQHSQPR